MAAAEEEQIPPHWRDTVSHCLKRDRDGRITLPSVGECDKENPGAERVVELRMTTNTDTLLLHLSSAETIHLAPLDGCIELLVDVFELSFLLSKPWSPRVFDYFLAYTLRYGGADIGHYTHMRFAHGNDMIKEHHSLALHQNEGLECCNSEDKQNQQAHGMHGGCNADMRHVTVRQTEW